MKALLRMALRTWARVGKSPGLYYQVVEKFGAGLASGPLKTRLPNGCVMQCDVTDHVQRHIYFLGVYEAIEASLFCRLLKPGDTVIDAGANVGQYSLLASTQVGPSGQVHAFEPVPRNFAALSRNVQLNNLSNVRLNQIALWNEPSELVFERPEEPDSNNGSFGAINPGNAASTNQTRVTVPAIPLDQYVEENQLASVDFIKMDIEGASLSSSRALAVPSNGSDPPFSPRSAPTSSHASAPRSRTSKPS